MLHPQPLATERQKAQLTTCAARNVREQRRHARSDRRLRHASREAPACSAPSCDVSQVKLRGFRQLCSVFSDVPPATILRTLRAQHQLGCDARVRATATALLSSSPFSPSIPPPLKTAATRMKTACSTRDVHIVDVDIASPSAPASPVASPVASSAIRSVSVIASAIRSVLRSIHRVGSVTPISRISSVSSVSSMSSISPISSMSNVSDVSGVNDVSVNNASVDAIGTADVIKPSPPPHLKREVTLPVTASEFLRLSAEDSSLLVVSVSRTQPVRHRMSMETMESKGSDNKEGSDSKENEGSRKRRSRQRRVARHAVDSTLWLTPHCWRPDLDAGEHEEPAPRVRTRIRNELTDNKRRSWSPCCSRERDHELERRPIPSDSIMRAVELAQAELDEEDRLFEKDVEEEESKPEAPQTFGGLRQQFMDANCRTLRQDLGPAATFEPFSTEPWIGDQFTDVARVAPAPPLLGYHGTDVSNIASIATHSLCAGTVGGRVPVLHGQAHGAGVYLSRAGEPWLAKQFASGPGSLLICAVVDGPPVALPGTLTAAPRKLFRLGGCHRQQHKPAVVQGASSSRMGGLPVHKENAVVRHVGAAMVVKRDHHVCPLFRAYGCERNPRATVASAVASGRKLGKSRNCKSTAPGTRQLLLEGLLSSIVVWAPPEISTNRRLVYSKRIRVRLERGRERAWCRAFKDDALAILTYEDTTSVLPSS